MEKLSPVSIVKYYQNRLILTLNLIEATSKKVNNGLLKLLLNWHQKGTGTFLNIGSQNELFIDWSLE